MVSMQRVRSRLPFQLTIIIERSYGISSTSFFSSFAIFRAFVAKNFSVSFWLRYQILRGTLKPVRVLVITQTQKLAQDAGHPVQPALRQVCANVQMKCVITDKRECFARVELICVG